MTIHFICRGNTLRSLLAETYLRSLQLKAVETYSSGTVADTYRAQNLPYFQQTTTFLANRGLAKFAKQSADQLTIQRLDTADITICMNQVVASEIAATMKLPPRTNIWNITDIGEGGRTANSLKERIPHIEEIFLEIKQQVDKLVIENKL